MTALPPALASPDPEPEKNGHEIVQNLTEKWGSQERETAQGLSGGSDPRQAETK